MSNFFGTALTGGSTQVVTYDGPVFEGYNVEHDGEFSIAIESAQDQLEIVAALAALDVQTTNFVKESMATDEEGLEYVAESFEPVLEASGVNVFTKIKEAIKKLWGKVKAFFASVLRSVDGVTKSAQDFVKKYKKQIQELKLTGLKHEMFTYTVEDLNLSYKADAQKDAAGVVNQITSVVSGGDVEKAQDAVNAFREGRDERLQDFRASVIGAGGKLDEKEFREAVRKQLRGGKDEKAEVNVNIHAIIGEIEGTGKLTSKIAKVQKEADKVFGDSIKLVDQLEKTIGNSKEVTHGHASFEYKKADGGKGTKVMPNGIVAKASVVASAISSELSAQQAIVNTAISEWTSAIKERDGVYKKVIMKAFNHKQEA